MKRTDNHEESKRVFMDLDVIKKCSNPYIIKCIGYMITFVCFLFCIHSIISLNIFRKIYLFVWK